MGLLSGGVVGGSGGVLGDVSVVVSLHFVIEDLGFGVGCLGDELGVDQVEDVSAVFVEFGFDLGFVSLEEADVLGSLLFFLLLDGTEGSPGGPSRSDGVLVCNGKEVSLLDAEVGVGLDDVVHGFEHVLKSLGLLGDLGHVDPLFPVAGSH